MFGEYLSSSDVDDAQWSELVLEYPRRAKAVIKCFHGQPFVGKLIRHIALYWMKKLAGDSDAKIPAYFWTLIDETLDVKINHCRVESPDVHS